MKKSIIAVGLLLAIPMASFAQSNYVNFNSAQDNTSTVKSSSSNSDYSKAQHFPLYANK